MSNALLTRIGRRKMGEHEHGHTEIAEHGHEDGHSCCDEHGCHAHELTHEHGHGEKTEKTEGDLLGDGGIIKTIVRKGDAEGGKPPVGAEVRVHYVGTLMDGEKFDSSRDRPGFFKFDIGRQRVIKGWDVGVSTMHKGEVAILECRHDYAYGAHGHPPTIPGGATLKFEVELFDWKEARKQKSDMSAAERVAEAAALKAKGTDAFKAKKWADAQELYHDAGEYVDGEGGDDARALLLSCLLNQAQCALAQSEWAPAAAACTRALALDAASMKAYFRRGKARVELGEFDDAKADLREAAKLDPKSREVREAIAEAKARAEKAKANDKAMYSKMFG